MDDAAQIQHITDELQKVLLLGDQLAERFGKQAAKVHPAFHHSVYNLLDYMALRHVDLRPVQPALTKLGLSSLGRTESHVHAGISAVLRLLHLLQPHAPAPTRQRVSFDEGRHLLMTHSQALLGQPWQARRKVCIMVTLPTEAAEDLTLVTHLLLEGTDLFRINCAHDHADIWTRMVQQVREASRNTGRPAKILMDLAGPKLRTARLATGRKGLRLSVGDRLILHTPDIPGDKAQYDEQGSIRSHAHIGCTLPEVFDDLRPGELVSFDDGKFVGRILSVQAGSAELDITFTAKKDARLKADKGINFPQSDLKITGLTAKDRADLAFVTTHADMVALSFVNQPSDVEMLISELDDLQSDIGLVLKIETQKGFRNLPLILIEAMKRYPLGVMIARGDLAIETGWERMAELQEEILWICEAAHIPVIWATQVLESVARTGVPSRAEITDAAMAQRAEAVMLNKGEHILTATRMLDNILTRMQDHQRKKSATLRPLKVSDLGLG